MPRSLSIIYVCLSVPPSKEYFRLLVCHIAVPFPEGGLSKSSWKGKTANWQAAIACDLMREFPYGFGRDEPEPMPDMVFNDLFTQPGGTLNPEMIFIAPDETLENPNTTIPMMNVPTSWSTQTIAGAKVPDSVNVSKGDPLVSNATMPAPINVFPDSSPNTAARKLTPVDVPGESSLPCLAAIVSR